MTVGEAKSLYRLLWMSFLSNWEEPADAQCRWRIHQMTHYLDQVQPHIGAPHSKEWEDFARTLPGFVAFWEKITDSLLRARQFKTKPS